MFNVVLRALSCLIPCCHIEKYQMARRPEDDAACETFEESSLADRIKEVIERVLIAENQPRSKYRQVIQGMLDKLPKGEGWSRDIPTLVAHRFRVLDSKERVMDELPRTTRPIWATGTDCDDEKIFIFVPPDIAAIVNNSAYPYLVSREVYHILERDRAQMHCAKAVISCAAIALTRSAEKRADAFATRHSTAAQKEYALNFERVYWYAR